MFKCYNYDTGKLKLSYDSINFDLDLRNPITQIGGDSGTGKTLLVSTIRELKDYSLSNSEDSSDLDVSNIVVIDTVRDLDLVFETKYCLIIIDRFDFLVGGKKDIIDYIALDRKNHYLIFARKGYPLGLSPNYYGEFRNDSDVIKTYFRFSEKGWF